MPSGFADRWLIRMNSDSASRTRRGAFLFFVPPDETPCWTVRSARGWLGLVSTRNLPLGSGRPSAECPGKISNWAHGGVVANLSVVSIAGTAPL